MPASSARLLMSICFISLSLLLGCSESESEKTADIASPKADVARPSSSSTADDKGSNISSSHQHGPIQYQQIEWTDLMPQAELDALLNPPAYLDEVEDGSFEDKIASQIQAQLNVDLDDPYQQALVSTNIVEAMDQAYIRLPGFVVPLSFGESEFMITEFFFVPFFGACIHLPPPPPNQILYVNYPQGIELKALYDAFWLNGQLSTELIENDTAIAAYQLSLHSIEPYYE